LAAAFRWLAPSPVCQRSRACKAWGRPRRRSPRGGSAITRELDDLANRRRNVDVVELESGERADENSDSVSEGKTFVHDDEGGVAHPAQSPLSLQELVTKSLGADNDANPRRQELELDQ
jgi:hypothetical protein